MLTLLALRIDASSYHTLDPSTLIGAWRDVAQDLLAQRLARINRKGMLVLTSGGSHFLGFE